MAKRHGQEFCQAHLDAWQRILSRTCPAALGVTMLSYLFALPALNVLTKQILFKMLLNNGYDYTTY